MRQHHHRKLTLLLFACTLISIASLILTSAYGNLGDALRPLRTTLENQENSNFNLNSEPSGEYDPLSDNTRYINHSQNQTDQNSS